MGKLSKAFAAASLFALAACTTQSVPFDEPGHRPRPLTSGEVSLAQKVFGNQIDYRKIRISSHLGPTSKAFHGRIRMSANVYAADYSKQGSFQQAHFLHELTHIWQEQNGQDIVSSAIGEFFRHGGNYQRAYIYHISNRTDFRSLGIEQQASIVEDYWRAVRFLEATRQCDEVIKFERVLKPVFPAIRTPAACR